MAPVVTLDEHHRYWMDDGRSSLVRLAGCTDILTAVGISGSPYWTQESRDRGSYVHAIIESVVRGRTFFLPEHLVGYVASFRIILNELHHEIGDVEKILYHAARRIAGTNDLLSKSRKKLWDVKTGAPDEAHAIQTAGYAFMIDPIKTWEIERFGIYLDADGRRPKVIPFTDRADVSVFLGAAAVYSWREAHGKIESDKRRAEVGDRQAEGAGDAEASGSGAGFGNESDGDDAAADHDPIARPIRRRRK